MASLRSPFGQPSTGYLHSAPVRYRIDYSQGLPVIARNSLFQNRLPGA